MAETRPGLGSLLDSSTRWRDERAENRAGQQELQICGEAARAVPASAAVEEFAAARAQERQDVLEVGCGARRGAERRRIERATARGEEDEARETAADLEAARADVLVRQPIAREMKDRAEHDRREPRPGEPALFQPLPAPARDGNPRGRPRLPLDRMGLGRELDGVDEGLHAFLRQRELDDQTDV